jgi:hypothetical protein
MALPGKYVDLVSSLIERTEQGDVEWRDTSASDQLAVYLRSGDIAVDYYPEQQDPRHGTVPEMYGMTIFNNDGNKIDEITADKTNNRDSFEILKRLYETARRNYLKVDETIEGMLEEINEDENVGGEDQDDQGTFEPDEDLPF